MKKCNKCGELKDNASFNKKNNRLQSYCKDCQKEYRSKHYANNKEQYLEKNRRLNNRNTEFVYNYLLSHPCVDCGEDDPIVLDFDHQSNKTMGISEMTRDSYSVERIEKEILKCDVRCANCHRKKTAKEGNFYRYLRGLV